MPGCCSQAAPAKCDSSKPLKLAALGVALSAAVGIGYLAYKKLTKPQKKVLKLPVIDLSLFLNKDKNPDAYKKECKKVAEALHKYGVLVVKDPRVKEEDNTTFLNMMERYFGLSDGERDARPQFHYQVGVTPQFVEKPKDHCHTYNGLGPDNQPLSLCPPEKDPKWRFFWRIGKRPEESKFPALNAPPVIPPEIPEWSSVMDKWGNKIHAAYDILAVMAAEGFGLEADAFSKKIHLGPHLLAPTGSDFNKFGEKNRVLAGYHYDLNFLTIHGKSKFPGLSIWTRDKEKVGVAVPDGCLFVQAGKQIEYLTGGHVLAGFHEVVVGDNTIKVINEKKAAGESLWRVSSTFFGHTQSDQILEPLGHFKTAETAKEFPPILAGDQVQAELKSINLDQSKSE